MNGCMDGGVFPGREVLYGREVLAKLDVWK
jgi:hypothetical protein